MAGQGGSLGADAAQVALPPLRIPRREDSLQGLCGGGAMQRISLPVSATRLIPSDPKGRVYGYGETLPALVRPTAGEKTKRATI